MSTAVPPHRPCREFERQSEGLDDDAVYRFIIGKDDSPQKLNREEASRELGDPFAQLLLLEEKFPRTAGAVLAALEDVVTADDPLRRHRFFVVGEGGQIQPVPGVPPAQRNLRFLVTCGTGPDGPDIMMTAFHPDHGTIELMAWDRRVGGFNFYRTVGSANAWIFAGNSRHALAAPTRDNGPFESHKNGHFLMKELRLPWINWDSPKAKIARSIFTAEGLADHPWIRRLEPAGAYTLEDDIAISSITRWTRSRFDALLSGNSKETPRRIFEQLLVTLTVNLRSSHTSSEAAVAGAVSEVDLPDTFFVDSGLLVEVLGLQSAPAQFVASTIYARSLETFAFTFTDGAEFSRKGDTHFAFVVPERAFEDIDTIRQVLERGIIDRRLVASLLMVDFPNPIFSARRQQLLQYVPDTPMSGSPQDFAEQVANSILGTPEAAQAEMAENEFAERWNAGESFEDTFNNLLQRYYNTFVANLGSQQGFDEYVLLAESRRAQVIRMPIFESPLLFARTNIPIRDRAMRADGTVEEI